MKHLLWIIGSLILFSACQKEEGQGGQATIRGKVFGRYYNNSFSTLIGQAYVPEADVYIIYGDGFSYGDRVRTNYDGAYEFKYLREGNYKVYVYSKDTLDLEPSGVYPVIASVKISKKDQVVTLEDLIINQN